MDSFCCVEVKFGEWLRGLVESCLETFFSKGLFSIEFQPSELFLLHLKMLLRLVTIPRKYAFLFPFLTLYILLYCLLCFWDFQSKIVFKVNLEVGLEDANSFRGMVLTTALYMLLRLILCLNEFEDILEITTYM